MYRLHHGISDADHAAALRELGIDAAEYAQAAAAAKRAAVAGGSAAAATQ
jgi:hypothetical protein